MKFKSESADGYQEFFFVGKKTVAINGGGDEFAATVTEIYPSEKKVRLSFEDGSEGKWDCGATSNKRLA